MRSFAIAALVGLSTAATTPNGVGAVEWTDKTTPPVLDGHTKTAEKMSAHINADAHGSVASSVTGTLGTASCPIECKFDNGVILTQHTSDHTVGSHGPSTNDAKCQSAVGGCTASVLIAHTCTHDPDTGFCSCTCKTPNYNTVEGTVNCGASYGNNCVGKTCPTATSKHAVRCCSDTAKSGFHKRFQCSVWGSSLNAVCHVDKTFAEATEICAAENARLCTSDELENDCARGTGCGFDHHDVWAAEAKCVVSVTESTTLHGYKTVRPGYQAAGANAGKALESCSDPQDSGATMSVRCCSDTAKGGWTKRSNCAVWGGSDDMDTGKTCHESKTYAEAEAICVAANARLCTAAELEGDCTRGSGCGFDGKAIWSSTSCTV
jgi:hypothetical protein